MRALVHSIHSQVPQTIDGLERRPEMIVSMDSHLDVSLGGDYLVYPEELRVFAARTGAHSAFRNIKGGLSTLREPIPAPRLIVVIPEMMVVRHVAEVERQLPRELRVSDRRRSISSWAAFMKRAMGIEIFQSPPRPLTGLVRRVRGRSWLLDIDVDYIQEMQKECYTRIIKPGPGVLQSMAAVLEFVRRSRPETITISEAKVSAIRDPKSAFSRLRGGLRSMGYEFEEVGVYASDSEVYKGISVCRDFYRTVSRGLMASHMDAMMRGELEGFKAEERAAARRFFRSKGYGRSET